MTANEDGKTPCKRLLLGFSGPHHCFDIIQTKTIIQIKTIIQTKKPSITHILSLILTIAPTFLL